MLSSEILYLAELHGFTPEATQALLDAAEAAEADGPAGPTGSGPSVTLFQTLAPPSEGSGLTSTPTITPESQRTAHAGAPVHAGVDRDLKPIQDLGLIARGGMGEVRRVLDPNLSRTVAMKVARPGLARESALLQRFLAEARVTARLQHPGVVPVHALGFLPDGRPYFLMREVTGPTLAAAIREVHDASKGGRWAPSPSGWTFRRLIDALNRACEAMAYAHARGVVHRDLKPENIMLGRYGEVLVLDWGLARASVDEVAPPPFDDEEDTDSVRTVAGTPAYMAPEQAAGGFERMGPEGDVYALGATLYEILTGRAPYEGRSAMDVLDQVRARAPLPPRAVVGSGAPPIPPELEEICQRAMTRDPRARLPDASALGKVIVDWLEGVRRREEALSMVATADALHPQVRALRARAATLRARAAEALAPLKRGAPSDAKEPGWALDDEARHLEQRARLAELEVIQGWRAALSTEPDLPDAHERLADYYQAQHAAAEDRRDHAEAEALAMLLRGHDAAGRHAAWLNGEGRLTLHTDPPGAEATLYRYEERARRLVPVPDRALGHTPLTDRPIAMGSYLVELRAPDRATVRYPVYIRRCERWLGAPPGQDQPLPIPLPRSSELGPDDVYVPPGWFFSGGSAEAPPSRVWVPGFVIRRFPVTNAEYLLFLNDLISNNQEEAALKFAPRARGGHAADQGGLIYHREASGAFILGSDAEGHVWLPDYPVLNVDWYGARAYARWEAARTGQPWRLPREQEREKAARGVDGRSFPWGDFLDPSFCCFLESHAEARTPSPVTGYPVDVSPYGARGLAGNSRDWCEAAEDAPAPSGDEAAETRNVLGGSWVAYATQIGASKSFPCTPLTRKETIGLRLARSWSPEAGR